ncbi:hypothetical protein C8R43DRAFT_1137101 [Mycena crocata]|nr:hypothetical protein C8R43DRAFT_1137101 [Mycena crocata]
MFFFPDVLLLSGARHCVERGSSRQNHARAAAFATFSARGPLGAALGMVLGGLVTQLSRYTWRAQFFLSAALAFATLVAGVQVIPADPPLRSTSKANVESNAKANSNANAEPNANAKAKAESNSKERKNSRFWFRRSSPTTATDASTSDSNSAIGRHCGDTHFRRNATGDGTSTRRRAQFCCGTQPRKDESAGGARASAQDWKDDAFWLASVASDDLDTDVDDADSGDAEFELPSFASSSMTLAPILRLMSSWMTSWRAILIDVDVRIILTHTILITRPTRTAMVMDTSRPGPVFCGGCSVLGHRRLTFTTRITYHIAKTDRVLEIMVRISNPIRLRFISDSYSGSDAPNSESDFRSDSDTPEFF